MRLGPIININSFVDSILAVVFDNARQIRNKSPDSMRSIVFSSYNPTVCTALNWKQPNFPVFLCNDLGREGAENMLPAVPSSGRRTTSIKETVRIAQSNNFMGLICCSRLLVGRPTPAAVFAGASYVDSNSILTGHGSSTPRLH